ncbi:MAG: cytochrome P460 family protein [Bdellovibrionales bacterium]
MCKPYIFGILALSLLLASPPLNAADAPAAAEKLPPAFPYTTDDGRIVNGIRFSDYNGFEKNWKLVTVTYRTDAREMRFAYANDLAYQTLLNDSTDYPDGATFIKAVAVTMGDPAFIDSKLPASIQRYQVMVRNAEKYKSTDGWGYAPFDASGWGNNTVGWNGKLVEDNISNLEEKCHACHTFAKDRNYIFSKIAKMKTFNNREAAFPTGKNMVKERPPGVEFETMNVADIPEFIRQFIPPEYKKARRVSGKVGETAFVGAAYELRPSLIIEADRAQMPAIFFNEKGGALTLIFPTNKQNEPQSPTCKDGRSLYASYWVVGSSYWLNRNDADGWPSKDLFCYGVDDSGLSEPTPAGLDY